jgi:hypothetical protein
MTVCHVTSINPNQNTNQLITEPVNPDSENLQMGPTYQEFKHIVYTINHALSLCTSKIVNFVLFILNEETIICP